MRRRRWAVPSRSHPYQACIISNDTRACSYHRKMQTRLCVVLIASLWMAAANPAASGGKRKRKDLSECVTGEGGLVDMACLGGKSKGWSQLRVASSGVGGGIPGASETMHSILPGVRDCHEAAIGRGASGVDGGFGATINVDDRGRAAPPEMELERLSDKPLVECIRKRLAALRFKRPEVKGYGSAKIAIEMQVVGGPGKTVTKTLTDDARAMCSASTAMLAAGWRASRRGVLAELATRFAESRPSAAGKEVVDRLATVKQADIPAAWRKAIVARGVAAADAACPDMDKLLVGG